MRLPLLALVLLAQSAGPGATGQALTVTPQTLASWSLTGAEKNTLARDQQLVLPAGAQLSREFPSGPLIVHLVTRPVWSETAADWPILEVGPAALALIKKDGQGRLVLVVGEDRQTDLPWPVAPDALGRPLDVVLGYDPATGAGLVGWQDQIQWFEAGASLRPVAVILTAGGESAWPQDTLEVLVPDPVADTGGRDLAGPERTDKEARLAPMKSALAQLRAGSTPSAGQPLPAAASPESRPAVSTLEIFTPPAVRPGRADALRTTLAAPRTR